jgi:hypothetical protein
MRIARNKRGVSRSTGSLGSGTVRKRSTVCFITGRSRGSARAPVIAFRSRRPHSSWRCAQRSRSAARTAGRTSRPPPIWRSMSLRRGQLGCLPGEGPGGPVTGLTMATAAVLVVAVTLWAMFGSHDPARRSSGSCWSSASSAAASRVTICPRQAAPHHREPTMTGDRVIQRVITPVVGADRAEVRPRAVSVSGERSIEVIGVSGEQACVLRSQFRRLRYRAGWYYAPGLP